MNTPAKKSRTKKKSVKKKAPARKTAPAKASEGSKKSDRKTMPERSASATEKTVKNNDQHKLLKLHSVMIINDANTFHAGLVKFSETNTNIVIDASAVEMIDTAIMQLLLAFVQHVKKNNREVTWKNPSNEFCSRAEMLGISSELDVRQVC